MQSEFEQFLTSLQTGSPFNYSGPPLGTPSVDFWPMETPLNPQGGLSASPSTSFDEMNCPNGGYADESQGITPASSGGSSQDPEDLQAIKRMVLAQLAQPGIDSLVAAGQLINQYLSVLQQSCTTDPVQARTEEFRHKQNPTIPSMDSHPPFNPPALEFISYSPALPSQPSSPPSTFSAPQQLVWAETCVLPATPYLHSSPDGQDNYQSPHLLPLTSTPEQPTTSHSSPSGAEGFSTCREPHLMLARQSAKKRSPHRKKSGRSKKPCPQPQYHHCSYPGCSATYDTLGSLYRHIKGHELLKPGAKCQRCGKQLSRSDALRRHERSERACENYLSSFKQESGGFEQQHLP